jgi:uncharacterized protein (TIGR02449 family)
MVQTKLQILASRIDELIETVRLLRRDNQRLREREAQLSEEAQRLRAKNQEARERLDSIITRLKQHGGEGV